MGQSPPPVARHADPDQRLSQRVTAGDGKRPGAVKRPLLLKADSHQDHISSYNRCDDNPWPTFDGHEAFSKLFSITKHIQGQAAADQGHRQ